MTICPVHFKISIDNQETTVRRHYCRRRLRPVYCVRVYSVERGTSTSDIIALEGVQRRFTKRLPGMKSLTYHQRLINLDLESLELRRIRADLIFAYKLIILFGPVDIDPSEFFTVRVDDARWGHRYNLYLPGCKSAAIYISLVRVVRATLLFHTTEYYSSRKN